MKLNRYDDLGTTLCTGTTDNTRPQHKYLLMDVTVFVSMLSEAPMEHARDYQNMPLWQFRIEVLN